ncbi:unnamed protein product [Polarella glacialis]|uniref:Uncharacterized protein n=1 Tax=Polarella glacialis TaxID=89957 RepID=A0A813HQQ3_POLGL|nr:unnamed protein product [Polarella glacialis]
MVCAETAFPKLSLSLSRQLSGASTAASETASVGCSLCMVAAAQRGNTEAVQDMLRQGADPNIQESSSGWTPLMFAAAAGKPGCVKMLLAHGADADLVARPHDWTALTVAILSNNFEIVDLLLDAGANVSVLRRRHPDLAELYRAAQEQHRASREALTCPVKMCPVWVSDYRDYC